MRTGEGEETGADDLNPLLRKVWQAVFLQRIKVGILTWENEQESRGFFILKLHPSQWLHTLSTIGGKIYLQKETEKILGHLIT